MVDKKIATMPTLRRTPIERKCDLNKVGLESR